MGIVTIAGVPHAVYRKANGKLVYEKAEQLRTEPWMRPGVRTVPRTTPYDPREIGRRALGIPVPA